MNEENDELKGKDDTNSLCEQRQHRDFLGETYIFSYRKALWGGGTFQTIFS